MYLSITRGRAEGEGEGYKIFSEIDCPFNSVCIVPFHNSPTGLNLQRSFLLKRRVEICLMLVARENLGKPIDEYRQSIYIVALFPSNFSSQFFIPISFFPQSIEHSFQ